MTDENVVGARQMNAPAGNRVLMGHCISNVLVSKSAIA